MSDNRRNNELLSGFGRLVPARLAENGEKQTLIDIGKKPYTDISYFIQVLEALDKLDCEINEYEPLIPNLCDSLADNVTNKKLRNTAATLLGSLQATKAVEPLINTLGDYDEELRRISSQSLGLIKDKRAIGPLIEATKDSSEKVQHAANIALRKFKFDMLANNKKTTSETREQLKELEVSDESSKLMADLRELCALKEKDLLSDNQFEAAKNKLLKE